MSNNGHCRPPQFDVLLKFDWYLVHFEREISRRYAVFKDYLDRIEQHEGGLDKFTKGYEYFGIKKLPNNGVKCYEWAPGADALYLKGDFNGWKQKEFPYKKLEFGRWELELPPKPDGSCPIDHMSVLKVVVKKGDNEYDKLSPWATYVNRTKENVIYHQIFYNPPNPYKFQFNRVKKPRALRIYECHVGISSWEGKVADYRHFADNIIPRIVKQGYNSIQLMAVMEHVYYASFGYQVTSFFAASSRYGPPDDLKYMVDKAHEKGIYVLLDIVHSHASKNTVDGLNQWDGTNGCYFHDNYRGFHDLWDSRMFNYTDRVFMIPTSIDPRYKDKFLEKLGTMPDIVETVKTLVSNLNDQSQIIIPTPAKIKKKTENKRDIGSFNDFIPSSSEDEEDQIEPEDINIVNKALFRMETLRFLLSNLRWWIEEYNFDGFRFDGVTSMMYHSHGLGHGFSGDYNEYYGLNTDTEALNYLTLANYMLHKFYPDVTTIAESRVKIRDTDY
uniref:Glycosyl hydrolase family 13 catalytic domain-containing protein n=1 Tax=Romanomermis culicivorax TaxID=13658 RepID=A0A915L7E3_ROMCU